MQKKSRRFLSLLLALILTLGLMPGIVRAEGRVTRIAGSNRYKTAYAVADTLKQTLGVEKFDNIVVASGTGFADALAGSYLAAVKRAPILLAHPQLMQDVAAYIRANLADGGTVYLLGGPAAVPADMESHLSGLNVQRLAGNNRYGTNLKILEAAGSDPTVLICTGKGFADSLSASAVGKPILLVSDRLTAEQKAFLAAEPRYSYIIGGKNAVNETIEAELAEFGDVIRLEGKNRFETSVMVADFNSPSDSAVLAYAANFPDGLCGGPLAYALGAPLLLTQSGRENIADTFATSRSITTGIILGGEGLISSEAAEAIFDGRFPCLHNYAVLRKVQAAACTVAGYTGDLCCPDCGKVVKAGQVIPQAEHNWNGNICTTCYTMKPGPIFPNDDFITPVASSIDTGTFVYDIGEKVFVPSQLAAVSEAVAAAMEKVSGLKFAYSGHSLHYSLDEKVHVNVTRDNLTPGSSSELGQANASSSHHANISPGDLFLSSEYAIVHELAHVQMFRQSEWSYCKVLNEGFAEYTTYLAMKELEAAHPELAIYLPYSELCNFNMIIDDYAKLYEHPLEYWFDHTFEYSRNDNYAVGFRFMWYLHDVYGNYSKWITEYEKHYNFHETHTNTNQTTSDTQIKVLKATYGEDVLDNFYPWLQSHEYLFMTPDQLNEWGDGFWSTTNVYRDMTSVEAVNWYPYFNYWESGAVLKRIAYQDLYVNLETIWKYVSYYKNCTVTNPTLVNPGRIAVRLFYRDGSVVNTSASRIAIRDVSYIQLVGSGKLTKLEIEGFSLTQ